MKLPVCCSIFIQSQGDMIFMFWGAPLMVSERRPPVRPYCAQLGALVWHAKTVYHT